ncbi:MAG: hypothetical protein RIQ56_892 [Candidatus Parcubacteria bacterium]
MSIATPKFQRKKENFECEHCGEHVVGNGYTNHCPKCLWSKHVDNNPGDRTNACGGLMKPVRLEGTTPKYRIVHTCTICHISRIVTVAETDDPQALVTLSAAAAVAPTQSS